MVQEERSNTVTNFERFKAMDSDTFTDEIQKLFKTPFKAVIDWKAYMKGSSETVTDYLITEGRCRVLPSRVELLAALGAEGVNDKKKKAEYIKAHAAVMPLLKESSMYGNKMYTVADLKNNRILKVPAQYAELEGDVR